MSLISIPALPAAVNSGSLSAHTAVSLWAAQFRAGFALAPPIAILTASSLVFCGWSAGGSATSAANLRGGKTGARLFYVAAALTVAIVPFTVAFMGRTNEKLLGMEAREVLSQSEGREGVEALGRWVALNAVRSLLPLAGAVVAGVAVLGY